MLTGLLGRRATVSTQVGRAGERDSAYSMWWWWAAGAGAGVGAVLLGALEGALEVVGGVKASTPTARLRNDGK